MGGFHQIFHFASFLESDRFRLVLPNCWVLERKHKSVKAVGNLTVTRHDWDKTVLRESSCHHFYALAKKVFHGGYLVGSHAPKKPLQKVLQECTGLPDASSLQCARAAKTNRWEHIFQGDRVVYSPVSQPNHQRIGIVRLFVDFGEGILLCLLTPCCLTDSEGGLAPEAEADVRLSCHTPEAYSEWVPLSIIRAACIWAPGQGEAMRIFVPVWMAPRWIE